MANNEIYISGNAPIYAVDDDPIFQEILMFAYTRSELTNELVQIFSGTECLERLKVLKQNNSTYPCLILMDINMPGLSGIETVEKIRSDSSYRDIPIISMLSSSDESNDIKRSLAAGANEYREKPYDITQLKFIKNEPE